MNIKARILVLLVTLLFAASGFAGEEKIEWSQVPEKVQKTILQHSQGGTIEEIEKETEKKYGVVYEAEVKKPDGKKIEIKVKEDGTLIEVEDD